MRIISDFHDYYDTAMGYGVDYDTLWVRKEKPLDKKYGFPYSRPWSNRQLELDHTGHTIGFCGKLYPCIVLRKMSEDGKLLAKKICHSLEEIDSFVESNFKKKQIDYYYSKENPWGWRNWNLRIDSTHKSFAYWFKKFKELEDKYEQAFIDNNTPVFVDNKANVQLKQYEFYKVIDPYTAFQEIQMFFGKLRSPERPIPEVSDADMLEAKGFDPKWSFRKEPSRKRKK